MTVGLGSRRGKGRVASGRRMLIGALTIWAVTVRGQGLDEPAGVFVAGNVFAMSRTSDGAIVIGGDFVQVGNVGRARLARFTQEGWVDPGFAVEVNGPVRCIAVLPDDSLLIGGILRRSKVLADSAWPSSHEMVLSIRRLRLP